MSPGILIIDDEVNIRKFLSISLENEGYRVLSAESGEEGLEIIERSNVNIVILDINLPGISGVRVLEEIQKLDHPPLVIVITAYGDIRMAVEVMKLGAFDYITKPFELAEMHLTLQKAKVALEKEKQLSVFRRQASGEQFGNMIGESPIMKDIFKTIEKVARAPSATVLVTGESGTGKELAARAIHYGSEREKSPFVAINCTAIQETLLESELFGYEKGAFTDAKTSKKGLFELADGGTIFLDEIGDMNSKLQAKILRFLQDKTLRRLGGSQDIKLDVRIIAATNRDLTLEVSEGRFREDLYFRLKVIPINMPPLRERDGDILRLTEYYIQRYSLDFKKKAIAVDQEVRETFLEYYWPGNIRELKNTIERIMILENDDRMRTSHLPPEILRAVGSGAAKKGRPKSVQSFKDEKEEMIALFEKEYLARMLSLSQGNVTTAARKARIDRSSFQRLMRKHTIKAIAFKDFKRRT